MVVCPICIGLPSSVWFTINWSRKGLCGHRNTVVCLQRTLLAVWVVVSHRYFWTGGVTNVTAVYWSKQTCTALKSFELWSGLLLKSRPQPNSLCQVLVLNSRQKKVRVQNMRLQTQNHQRKLIVTCFPMQQSFCLVLIMQCGGWGWLPAVPGFAQNQLFSPVLVHKCCGATLASFMLFGPSVSCPVTACLHHQDAGVSLYLNLYCLDVIKICKYS